MKEYDLVIVGGGQSGIAAAHYAQKNSMRYVVLDAGPHVGYSWEDRPDSLTLVGPRLLSALPGLPMAGNPHAYPKKPEVARYLQQYVAHFKLDITLNTTVTSAIKQGEWFLARTSNGDYYGKSLVVATGPFQKPIVPAWQSALRVQNMHAIDYRRPSQMKGKRILVVGGGNAGAQIADQLAHHAEVHMSIANPMRFVPTNICGKSFFWWLKHAHILHAPKHSLRARMLRSRGELIMGTNVSTYIRQARITIRPQAIGGHENIVLFADGTQACFDSIVFCTGYNFSYPWLHIPQAIDNLHVPQQRNGIALHVPGLYFLGLGWMRSRSSALLGGVGRDARYIVRHARRIIFN